MHNLNDIDPGMTIDWGKTSRDYAKYRPGPPPSFYIKMQECGIGLRDQSILDLGTGTGVLAREFAKNGANVTGLDISSEQVAMASSLAKDEKLEINFVASDANKLPFEDNSFEAITANQCFLYFDKEKVIPEIKRLLKNGGLFSTSHFCWLPLIDNTAKKTEELILKHNPNWTAHSYSGEIPKFPTWAQNEFELAGHFIYDEEVAFTWESWCGRIRACRGVGAALSPEDVKKFDDEHLELLKNLVPENFTVTHRIDAHIYRPRK
ncbi:MAG: SAM-dependent methyltransferase [Halobacteriovorax sp.]|nr:SAM-dependent methyltransferase [Halobacteriovorax sp.]|tara:strand:+ start:90671 stop:91462 length:792 start_codon:yes stop_codon:yes gene_type:complete